MKTEDYGIDYDSPVSTAGTEDTVVIPRVDLRLTENGIDELNQIDVLQNSDDFGINVFINVLNIVQQNVS